MIGMVSIKIPPSCFQASFLNCTVAAALQYFQIACIILDLAKPKGKMTASENMKQITNYTRGLEMRASKICSLALSSDSQAVRINAFGPIPFCRFYLVPSKDL